MKIHIRYGRDCRFKRIGSFEIKTKPVSINDKYLLGRRGKKRIMILTNEYRDAKEAIHLEAKSQWLWRKFDKQALCVEIEHSYKRADIDAYIKIILDALQGVVYENDRQVRKLSVEII